MAGQAQWCAVPARAHKPFAQFLEQDHPEGEGENEEPNSRPDRRSSEELATQGA